MFLLYDTFSIIVGTAVPVHGAFKKNKTGQVKELAWNTEIEVNDSF